MSNVDLSTVERRPHRSTYSKPLLAAIHDALVDEWDRVDDAGGRFLRVLDPFAGACTIHRFASRYVRTTAVELEPEWAAWGLDYPDQRTFCGDSRTVLAKMRPERFDVVCTSPWYGNRQADHHEANDRCKACGGTGREDVWACRRCGGSGLSKRHDNVRALGRRMTDGNTGEMHWNDGPAGEPYRDVHRAVWAQCVRLLAPGGLFLLNCKNHQRAKREQLVTEWHLGELCRLGLVYERGLAIGTAHMRHGANATARHNERLLWLRKEA